MRTEKILGVLREVGTSLTIEELSERTGLDIVRLRVDLFKLAEEGKVECRQRGGKPVWTIRVGAVEEHHGKLPKKYPP